MLLMECMRATSVVLKRPGGIFSMEWQLLLLRLELYGAGNGREYAWSRRYAF